MRACGEKMISVWHSPMFAISTMRTTSARGAPMVISNDGDEEVSHLVYLIAVFFRVCAGIPSAMKLQL